MGDNKNTKEIKKSEVEIKTSTSIKSTKVEQVTAKKVEQVDSDKDETIVKVKKETSKKDKKKTPPAKTIVKKTIKYVSSSQLNKALFNVKVNEQAIFDSIMSERASRRQGTHQVKNRSAVAGGGIKPWKQKGTGRARAGTLSSPIFRSGGVVFGPQKNRNYKLAVNKKVKVSAFKSALTLKAKENSIYVQDLIIKTPSTKAVLKFIEKVDLQKNQKKILFISSDSILYKSTSNLEYIDTIKLSNLLIEKILHFDILIFSKEEFKELEGRV